jgi:hypothetical protein
LYLRGWREVKKKRLPEFAEIPTEAETGYSGVNLAFWAGLFAPKGVEKPILEKISTVFEKTAKNPEVIKKIKEINVLSTAPQFARVAQEFEAKLLESSYASEKNETIIPTHFYNPKLSGDLIRLADFIGGCGAGRYRMGLHRRRTAVDRGANPDTAAVVQFPGRCPAGRFQTARAYRRTAAGGSSEGEKIRI